MIACFRAKTFWTIFKTILAHRKISPASEIKVSLNLNFYFSLNPHPLVKAVNLDLLLLKFNLLIYINFLIKP